jgi:hypothetical protein
MFNLFVEGGVIYMVILTLIFIALFLAAWKAPAWVKEIGLIALVVGFIAFLVGMIIAFDVNTFVGEIPQRAIFSGLRAAMITPAYGFIIYLISLIIRIVQKPKI